MTGNKPTRGLTGAHLLLLVVFKFIWPQAAYFECIAFLANEADEVRIFSKQDISLALIRLGYTNKVTSAVAYQAFTERNIIHRRLFCFWARTWSTGIHRTRRRRIIDTDEFGVHLNSANHKYGSSPKGLKIRKPRNYNWGTFKMIVILAVEPGDPGIPNGEVGSITCPWVWTRVRKAAGTSAGDY